MTFEPGQKVELNALGRKRVERDSYRPKNRKHGVIVGASRVSPGCYRVQWATRKSVDFLHEDFLIDAAEHAEPEDDSAFGAWRPIETAPMDGSCVLVSELNGPVGEAWYAADDKNWWWAQTHPTDATGGAIYPEFWMPLPFPPVQPKQ